MSAKVERVQWSTGPCVVFPCVDTVWSAIHAERAHRCSLRTADRGWTAVAGDGDVETFNATLDALRGKTESLCLPNFRDRYRKRIPFDLVYRLWNYVNVPGMHPSRRAA